MDNDNQNNDVEEGVQKSKDGISLFAHHVELERSTSLILVCGQMSLRTIWSTTLYSSEKVRLNGSGHSRLSRVLTSLDRCMG